MNSELLDIAQSAGGMRIPGFMLHLIQRPMKHVPFLAGPDGKSTVDGLVVMEFNQQIFQREIRVSSEDACTLCGSIVPTKDRYEIAVREAVVAISRDVNLVVRKLLAEALSRLEEK